MGGCGCVLGVISCLQNYFPSLRCVGAEVGRRNQTPGLGPLLKAQRCGPRLPRPAEWGKGGFQPPETGGNPAVTSVDGIRRGKAWVSRTLRGRAAREVGGGIVSPHADPRRSCTTTPERGRETGQEKDRPKGRERGEMASQMEFAEPLLFSLVTSGNS